MCRIGKIKNSNVAGVNLSGIGIFVNQSIGNQTAETQATTSTKVYAIGVARGWTMFWVILSSLFSIAAIIFCAAALYRKIKDDNLGYDYLGVIVGILALFITFVVAWQIWTTIVTKEEIKKATNAADKLKEIERKLQNQRDLFEKRNLEIKHLISALHGETYKRKDFKTDTEYFLHCLDVIGCFLKSDVKPDSPPFNRCIEELEVTLRHIKGANDTSEILRLGGNKDFVRKWHHKAIQIIDTEANNLDNIKSRLTIIYEDYITLTKDVRIHPHKRNKTI